jgi:cobalt-zinc-cadmium efflux system membrane fusion protein
MAGRRTITTSATVAVAILCFAAGVYAVSHLNGRLTSDLDAGGTAKAQGSDPAAARTTASSGMLSVELNDKQMASVKVEPVGEYVFPVEKSSVGSIDFNEEMTVQVFTPYQGKIIETFA